MSDSGGGNFTKQETFAGKVRSEICHNKSMIARNKKSFTYGMLLCGKTFSTQTISMSTEYKGAARLYAKLIFNQVDMLTTVTTREYKGNFDRNTYLASVDDEEDRRKILDFFGHYDSICNIKEHAPKINRELLTDGSERFAFFAGAFLACANLSNPIKDYHLEFVLQGEELAHELLDILEESGLKFRLVPRRGLQVLYCKDSESIEEMLTMMGATGAMLDIVNVKIYKDVRNQVNRATNCETSNIEKTVSASTNQIADIRYLKQVGLFDTLEPTIKETALARIRHPDLSLRELSSRLGVSPSGLNHRLQKIVRIAREIRSR